VAWDESPSPPPAAWTHSVKTATQHEDIGCDGHKKIKGRQRPIVVDTLGLIMAVVVTDIGTDDRLGRVE
jgi:hypothetical protein